MRSELLHIGPFTLYGYGLMIGIGILAAWILAAVRSKKIGLDPDKVFSWVLCALIGGLGGAKVLFWILEWREIAADPGFLIDTIGDGFVVYGGIIGGILVTWIYCRIKKDPFPVTFDLFMPSIALAQGFGRLGCLLAGCCYGKETDGPFYVVLNHSDYAPAHVHLLPTQLISSFLNFMNALILVKLGDSRKRPTGAVGAIYLINYSAGRFLVEFLRGDPYRGTVGPLSTSQFIAVFTLAGGIFLLFFAYRRSTSQNVLNL
ncbi:MAG: prolipoprotein diacylglyceryl transferase [Blautia sp.]|nr:prolipoprotein diacylglyceryl transferase [Blautia sp.]